LFQKTSRKKLTEDDQQYQLNLLENAKEGKQQEKHSELLSAK
jgi:hypothetical protein